MYISDEQHMSPGLLRARQPFRLRNALTGLVLGGFAVGVWAYSLGAVKQDVFEDADEEARELARSGAQVKSLEDIEKERKAQEEEAAAAASTPAIPTPASGAAQTQTRAVAGDRPRGVVASLLYDHYPKLLDPATKTLIWGAPSVDNIGKLRASRK